MSTLGTLDTLSAAADAVAQLASVDLTEIAPADVPSAAAVLARMQAQVEGALVALAERLETEDDVLPREWSSAKDFLTHVTGGRKGTGAALVRTATRTRDLPALRTALREGTISLTQASVIGGKVHTLPRDEELRDQATTRMLDLAATGHDATELERSFLGVVKDLDLYEFHAGLEHELAHHERAAHTQRFLSLAPDGLGGAHLKGYGTLEEAELVKTILTSLAAPVTTEPGACGGRQRTSGRLLDPDGTYRPSSCPDPGCLHDGRDPRDHGTRLWDALVEACTRLQATDQLPHSHGTSTRLLIAMSYDNLADGLAATGVLESGDSLSAQTIRRLACDAEIIPTVLGTDSQVLDVGRTNRLVTAAIWHALVTRDQHCTFPGCRRLPHACDAHHIVHWADGGPTSLDNLALLCRRHHTLVHKTAWKLQLDPHTRKPRWQPPPDYHLDPTTRLSIAITPEHPPRAA